MPERRNVARQLRSLWGTLAAICLLAAGTLFGITRYLQLELEGDAARAAHRLAVERIEPHLVPADAKGPIEGTRYAELSAAFRRELADGPSENLRLWATDAQIVFAEKPELIGRRQGDVQDDIELLGGGASRSMVVGDRLRTLTMLRIGESQALIVVGVDRPHAPIVAKSGVRWYPWIKPALVAALVCFALWVLAALAAALLPKVRSVAARRAGSGASRPVQPRNGKPPKARRGGRNQDQDLPAYMFPGFREEVEARRRLEEELEVARRERDALLERVRRMEAEDTDRQDQAVPPGRPDRQQGSEAGSRV